MKPIKAIIIDGAQIHSEADFHRIMAQHYDFGPNYGNNLGAFRDMVTSGFLMNTLLVWKNSAISKQRLGNFYDRVIWYLAEQKVSNYDHKLKDCFDFSLE